MVRTNFDEKLYGALQEYIARFGHGSAKLARQAQSKEKTLEKMVRPPVPTLCPCLAHVCTCRDNCMGMSFGWGNWVSTASP